MSQQPNPAEWEAYFWPGTDVLKNKPGIGDADHLRIIEYESTFFREMEIRTGRVQIDRTHDHRHLRSIHRHLFGDLYEWAGEYRTVNVSKFHRDVGVSHHFGDHASMAMYMRQMDTLIRSLPWEELGRERTVHALAEVHTALNFAHPFREGNGRAARVFLEHLAGQGRFRPDFEKVSADDWNRASARTFVHPHGLKLDSTPLSEVYREILSE